MPGTTKLYLWDETADTPGAEWIEVKNQISYGDEQDMAGKVVTSIKVPAGADEAERQEIKDTLEVMLDVAIDGPFKILVWTVDWNLAGPDGKQVDLEFDAIRALSLEYADEINKLINDHAEVTGQGKGRKAKKK